MSEDRYNGWTNRETWAVALHINNDQGWQESVFETVRNTLDGIAQDPPVWAGPGGATDPTEIEAWHANAVGDAIRENVESVLDTITDPEGWLDSGYGQTIATVAHDIGSLWRVDWTELGRAFLEDLAEGEA